jgi:hypothetical protein
MKRRRGWGPEVLVLLGGLAFALLGRGRWANVGADHGFWFSAAQSMVSGGRALHEVRLQWGPMPLWILEGVGRVFGMHVASFVIFQFVVGLLGVLGVQVFARRFLSPVERWICAAILVTLILWMVGPGSLLYPCAFAMSQALFLAVVALFVSEVLLRKGRLLAAPLAGAVAGLTFVTKQEFGAAAALGIAALTVFQPRLSAARKLGLLLLSGALFLAAYFGILDLARHGDSWHHLFQINILWPWMRVPGPWAALYRRGLGIDEPAARFTEAANSLVDILAMGGTFWLVLYFVDLGRRARMVFVAVLAGAWIVWWWRWTEGSHFLPMTLSLPAILGSAILMLGRWRDLERRDPLRLPHPVPLPHLLPLPAGEVDERSEAGEGVLGSLPRGEGEVAAGPPSRLPHPIPLPRGEGEVLPLPAGEAGLAEAQRAEANRVRELPELPHHPSGEEMGAFAALALGALVLLQREGYRGNIESYYSGMGYVLIVPVAVPLIWRAIRGPRSAGKRAFLAAALFLLLIARFGIGRLRALEREWNQTVELATPRGTVYLDRGSAPILTSTFRFLDTNTLLGDRILMMPQTFGLDFLLDRRNLSYFIWISPGYLPDEAELVARLEKTPPKAAVIFEGSFGMFHSGQLGHGLADSVVRWLESHLPRQEKFGQGTGLPGRRFLP